ncbi:Uncharacterised protein [Candidatus Norongarragalina meridionalis]|nr:Uncharacterised protein [Candidatus Norongarragalina meridionalis]
MPSGSWTYDTWLCISGSNYGWIYSIGPSGHPSAGRMFKIELHQFTYSPPYPATLYCYEQFTDVNGINGGYGTLNSVPGRTSRMVPQGPLYSWHYASSITLVDGNYTQGGTQWVTYGCPPILHSGQQSGSSPQAHIYVDWGGYGTRRSTAIAAPDYTSVGIPFVGYLDSYIDVLAGRTASVLKTKQTRR